MKFGIKKRLKKPLKTGAYCGVALLVIGVISNIITQITGYYKIESSFLDGIFVLVGWIDLLLMIFFTYAFVILGKKFKSKLLVVMSWIFIVIMIMILISSILGSVVDLISKVSAADVSQNIEGLLTQVQPNNPDLLGNLTPEEEKLVATALIISWVVISIILGILFILFGIGLLKLGKNVKYAKACGILNIVAGATYIIFIGFAVELAAFIVGVILLFNAAKKFEK